jgi:hypothetical protein
MVRVADDPATALLAQTDGEPKQVGWVLLELGRAASKQGVGEGNIVARGDIQVDDLEDGALVLPAGGRPPFGPVKPWAAWTAQTHRRSITGWQ